MSSSDELYQKICTEINNWPAWKKKVYNEEFAKSTHAEELEIENKSR